jgi:hypothetical protein
MTAAQRGFRKFFPLIGLILLAVGLTALFAQIHPFATQVWDGVGANADELGGFVPAALLAANHAAQAWAFDRTNLLSTLADMLLSCWPMILVISGVVLLRQAFDGMTAAPQTAMSSSAKGEN